MVIKTITCSHKRYNPFLVYCRELAPGTVSLTCERAQGDDSKHDSHFFFIVIKTIIIIIIIIIIIYFSYVS